MECEIYNEIADIHSKKTMLEADIVDWFENCEDNIRDYGGTVDTLDLGSSAEMRKSSNLFSPT